MFQCSNVPMFKCSNVLMFKCSNVQIFKCSYFSYIFFGFWEQVCFSPCNKKSLFLGASLPFIFQFQRISVFGRGSIPFFLFSPDFCFWGASFLFIFHNFFVFEIKYDFPPAIKKSKDFCFWERVFPLFSKDFCFWEGEYAFFFLFVFLSIFQGFLFLVGRVCCPTVDSWWPGKCIHPFCESGFWQKSMCKVRNIHIHKWMIYWRKHMSKLQW